MLTALQRLEKLICTNPTLGIELKECLHSRNTLTSLSKFLITQDYDEYIREMTRRNLDWRNPLGQETYECFRYICPMEKNMLEAARDNGGFSTPRSIPPPSLSTGMAPSKGKSKGVFTSFEQSDPESEDESNSGVHIAAGHSDWIKPGSTYKFPCPLQNHNHKIDAFTDFLTLTPKDCWIKIPKGRICYTCLKPKGLKGVCKTRRCSEEKTREDNSPGFVVCCLYTVGCCQGMGAIQYLNV